MTHVSTARRVVALSVCALLAVAGLVSAAPSSYAANEPQQLVVDGGFEAGPLGSVWDHTSLIDFLPISDALPSAGDYGLYLCDYDDCVDEVKQTIPAPGDVVSATLSWHYAVTTDEPLPTCDDKVAVGIRAGDQTVSKDNCAEDDPDYDEDTLDVTALLNGVPHGEDLALFIKGVTDSEDPSAFFIDEVSLLVETLPTAPDAPLNVAVTPGDGSAWITWETPFDGNSPLAGYVVTVLPDGEEISASSNGVQVSGLTNGQAYTFAVAAVNEVAAGLASTSAPATPEDAAPAGGYHALSPSRTLDTRNSGAKLGPGSTLDLQVTGQGGIPAEDVTAVVLNMTVTNPTADGWLTVWPKGVTKPTASSLNFAPGLTVANLVQVGVGEDGNVSIYNSHGSSDVIVDVQGYVSDDVVSTEGLLTALTPTRLLDTRDVLTMLGPAAVQTLDVTGVGGVPAEGVAGVVLNVTVTEPTQAGWLTVYPSGPTRPFASNVNWTAGQTVPNRVIVPVGDDGRVDIYNAEGSTHVIVDIAGWYTDDSNPAAPGAKFTGVTPARVLDTRSGIGYSPAGAPVTPAQTVRVKIAGTGNIPAEAKAVAMNVTVTDTNAPSYLTVWPDGAMPLASDLNWAPGQTKANMVVVKLSDDGYVNAFNAVDSTSLIMDVVGWYG